MTAINAFKIKEFDLNIFIFCILGGGAELSLAPDLRVFSETQGKLSFVQAKMGLMPGWGGATRLKNLVGTSKALHLLLSCQTIDSKSAVNFGLCDKVFNEGDLLDQTHQWLSKLVQHEPEVIIAIKNSVNFVDSQSLENERRLFAPLWNGPANREALRKNLKH